MTLRDFAFLVETAPVGPVQYLNNVLEQDHRAIKRRVRASQHFRSFWGAWRTIAGYEAIHNDPQRPGVLECGGCEGRSAPSLHCWYVWIGSLIHLVIAPTSRSIPKLQHYPQKASILSNVPMHSSNAVIRRSFRNWPIP